MYKKMMKGLFLLLSVTTILSFTSCNNPLNSEVGVDKEALKKDLLVLDKAKEALSKNVKDVVNEDESEIVLPSIIEEEEFKGVVISWTSGNDKVIADNGKVTHTPKKGDEKVTLKASLKKGYGEVEMEKVVTVKNPSITKEEKENEEVKIKNEELQLIEKAYNFIKVNTKFEVAFNEEKVSLISSLDDKEYPNVIIKWIVTENSSIKEDGSVVHKNNVDKEDVEVALVLTKGESSKAYNLIFTIYNTDETKEVKKLK